MIFGSILLSAVVIALYMSAGFVLAQVLADNSIVDVMWGIGFIIMTLFTLIFTGTYLPRQLLITTLVLIWGFRLGVQIGLRNWGRGEDIRYKNWRQQWGDKFLLYSFLKIFMLQGLVMLFVVYPVILVNITPVQKGLNVLDGIGLLVWCIGLFFEVVGDAQLYQFIKNNANKGKLMTTGLWRYTRHPNYFGEATMWWGIFLIALSVSYGWTALVSPALITYLLLYVSGVPMTERLMENHPDFAEYKRRTSTFFPWFVS